MAIAGLILGVFTLALATWGFFAAMSESGIDAELLEEELGRAASWWPTMKR